MENSNVRVDFRIIGDNFCITQISDVLKISPTQYWSVGDEIRNTGKFRKYTCWIFSTGYEETMDINTQLIIILNSFAHKSDILSSLKKQYELDYSIDIVVIVERGEVPAIYLEPLTLKFAAKIGARFDFDMYINS